MAYPGPSMSPDKQHPDTAIRMSTTNRNSDTGIALMNRPHTTDSLEIFVSTLCDKQATDMATMIRSSIDLFGYCIPSRGAILEFYKELFSEYNTYYWIVKKRSITSNPTSQQTSMQEHNPQSNKTRIEYVGELTRRFYQVAKLKQADQREDQEPNIDMIPCQIPSSSKSMGLTGPDSPTNSSQTCSSPASKGLVPIVGPRVIPVSRRTSSCNSASDINDQTPMSPLAQDDLIEEVAEPDEEAHYDNDSVDIFVELEIHINEIKTSFKNIIDEYMDVSNHPSSDSLKAEFYSTLTNWASDLLVNLNIKYSQLSTHIATELNKTNPTILLTRQINLCIENPVNKLLIDILLELRSNFRELFSRIMSSPTSCDWILAHILLEMSKRPDCDQIFAESMTSLISKQSNISSLTYILAYLSDNNPKAMTNFPKSNIPFLVSLCQSSISLLNVLALEIPDRISPIFLNNLAKEIHNNMDPKSHSSCIESVTHCVIAAPNTYKLFLLAFDIVLDAEISLEVKSASQIVIDSILMRIHERATQGFLPHSNLMPNPHLLLIDGLLNQLNNNLAKLIEKSSSSKYVAKKANAIFYRMSLIFGHTFASKVICHYLNLSEEAFWPLLKPILHRFMDHFGDDGSTLVSQTLTIDSSLRTLVYLSNLNTLINKCPNMKLDLDLISQLLNDKLSAPAFDISSTAQLIRLCCSSLERVDQARIRIATKHRLCRALATCYFLLLENETDEFPEILSYIRISLTCMSLLKQSTVASHILCRALLERSLVYGHLFNENFNSDLISDGLESTKEFPRNDTMVRLSKENLKVSLGHRFRRLPYHERTLTAAGTIPAYVKPSLKQTKDPEELMTSKPDKRAINSYLLIEAFKSSINNIEAFASLFVEFHCPVMFDKHLWPSDEALRVINEKNLAILRRFEQVPPFWDLFDFIGEAKCLKSCLVLVKALLAAHLALWASATAKSCPDKMNSTSRLIPPLARSGLIPRAFGLTIEVFEHFSPNEVFSVLSDIWQYLKDTNINSAGSNDGQNTPEKGSAKEKTYLNRLRLFMCQHMPCPTYVKIFKEFYEPVA